MVTPVRRSAIRMTRHFETKYLSSWRWSPRDLEQAIANAYRTERIGKRKLEIYVNKKGYKKIIAARDGDSIICISGSEGGNRR